MAYRILMSAFLLVLWVSPSATAQERPNIILIMCDDLGWGDLSFNNPKSKIQTPHLDEMAKNSLRFSRFYAAAPVCSPTRGSCLTGRHPLRYGITGANKGHLKQSETTITKLAKSRGYATGHFGKWHLGTLTKKIKDSNRGGPKSPQHFAPPWERDFDVCFSTEAKVPTFDPLLKPKQAPRTAWDSIEPDKRNESEVYGTRYWNEKGESVEDDLFGDDSKLIMDRAVKFIGQCAEDKKKFFTVIWFHSPHLPVVAGPRHRKPYESMNVHQRNYFGCITALDEQIGRLRKLLRDKKISEDTIIFFCSDNGPEGNQSAPGLTGGFRGRKRSLYEGGVRVPALIEWPAKIKAGSSTDFPAVTSDYLPTVAQILDVDVSKVHLDGESLAGVWAKGQKERKWPIGFKFGAQKSWVANQFKIYKSKNRDWELYDLIQDPKESQNLAEKEPQTLKKMKSEFEKWEASLAPNQ